MPENSFVFIHKDTIWQTVAQNNNKYEFHEILVHDAPTKMYFDVDMTDDMCDVEELCRQLIRWSLNSIFELVEPDCHHMLSKKFIVLDSSSDDKKSRHIIIMPEVVFKGGYKICEYIYK